MKIVSTTYLKNNVLQASSFLKRYQAVQALCNSDGGVFFLFFFGINMYCLRDTGVILGLHEVVHFRNTMVTGRRPAGLLGDKVDSYVTPRAFSLGVGDNATISGSTLWSTCHACGQAVRRVSRDRDHHRQPYAPDRTRSLCLILRDTTSANYHN
ncbi:hypothetical protein PGB90_006531 [Kerria lacca]